jgi:ABC-2 type transport system ATP-binding protein
VLALASGADVLLVDEPADGLDPVARRRLYDRLREHANHSGATVLVVTHIIGDIERVADDVAILHHGRLVLHQPLEDLREQVREIELQSGTSIPSLPDGVELLGMRAVGDSQLMWVRCIAAVSQNLAGICGVRSSVRHVDLETLYLALTEHRRDAMDRIIQEAQR